ncbi:PhnA protein [Candidatus Gracilibacteria bacterium]|nr:PhnA protein [Candidatus Gracilibacteria bacterium]
MAKKQKDFSWLDDSASSQEVITQDSNGATLQNGDNVRAIKDIKVSGASDIKRGDIFKNIRLTDDSTLIESGKMVLKTEFFKKQ